MSENLVEWVGYIANLTLKDWVGYAAMLTLMVSFMIKDMKKLRIINTIGCLLFVVYGFMLDSNQIIITNAFISMVNFYYLFIKKN